ncbi:MAG: hypothetical protein B9S36_01155 [Verrucomicrobiia bacterium Tous-C2TDCM]|nr:MAG: hypothetical protein B9S36_01155 [Verrucomicrobiae bacterium Tous-C2TDCM]
MKHSLSSIFACCAFPVFSLLSIGCGKTPESSTTEALNPAPAAEAVSENVPKAPAPSAFEAGLIQRFEGNQRDVDVILARVQPSTGEDDLGDEVSEDDFLADELSEVEDPAIGSAGGAEGE